MKQIKLFNSIYRVSQLIVNYGKLVKLIVDTVDFFSKGLKDLFPDEAKKDVE